MAHQQAPSILYAGGGSGGHISPAIAIAEAVARLRPDARQIVACSDRAIDALMLKPTGISFISTAAAPFSTSPRGAIRFVRGWRRTRAAADDILLERKVDIVIACGGFVAAPVARAAAKRKIPVLLLNLDAHPGKANRLAARWATQIVSVCETPRLPRFAEMLVPFPLRSSTLATTFGSRDDCCLSLGLNPDRNTLLVTGASQGSRSLNELVPALGKAHPEAFTHWQVYHLCGSDAPEPISDAYQAAGINAVVEPFQHEMGRAWSAADLAISRAGANSVAEIAINCVPTIFLPYPFHRDRHQFDNAAPLAACGGAVILDDLVQVQSNLNAHASSICQLLQADHRRLAMQAALLAELPVNGAEVIAEIALGHTV
ncbi:MAG: UDP-N-acetylglucosamine--N-acetylmuramyl-(pentapeptide) pyrophosphoryl-undecaprenol N-acetylglucosamine transferase [Phycisphaerales bacterium]